MMENNQTGEDRPLELVCPNCTRKYDAGPSEP